MQHYKPNFIIKQIFDVNVVNNRIPGYELHIKSIYKCRIVNCSNNLI
jgi:hypothetical protein